MCQDWVVPLLVEDVSFRCAPPGDEALLLPFVRDFDFFRGGDSDFRWIGGGGISDCGGGESRLDSRYGELVGCSDERVFEESE